MDFNMGNVFDPVQTQYDKTPNFSAAAQQQGGFDPGPSQQSVSGWDKWLNKLSSDPNLQASLISAGVQMMTPKGPNDNAASKIGQGINQGIGMYQGLENNDANRARINAGTEGTKAQTEGRKTENAVGAATAQDRIQQQSNATSIGGVQAENAPTLAKQQITANDNANTISGVNALNAPKLGEQQISMNDAEIANKGASTAYMNAASNAQNALATYRNNGGASGAAGGKSSTKAVDAAYYATSLYGPLTEENKEKWNAEWRKQFDKPGTAAVKSLDDMRLDLYEQAHIMSMPDGPKKQAKIQEIEQYLKDRQAAMDRENTVPNAAAPAGGAVQVDPADQPMIDDAIQRYVATGMTPEAARQKTMQMYAQHKQGQQP